MGHAAQSTDKRRHTHTHSHIHVGSACHGNPQQHNRINYRPVVEGVMLHWVSREGGRSMLTAEGSEKPNTDQSMVGAELTTREPLQHLWVTFHLVTSPPYTVQETKSDPVYTRYNTQPCSNIQVEPTSQVVLHTHYEHVHQIERETFKYVWFPLFYWAT